MEQEDRGPKRRKLRVDSRAGDKEDCHPFDYAQGRLALLLAMTGVWRVGSEGSKEPEPAGKNV